MNWIAVNDEYPENRVEVLTFGKGGYRISAYSTRNKIWTKSGAFSGITHWAAISPPKANEVETEKAAK